MIQLDDETMQRHTLKHVRFSSETAILFQDDNVSSATPDQPQGPQPTVMTVDRLGPMRKAQQLSSCEPIRSRSCRIIKKPARY